MTTIVSNPTGAPFVRAVIRGAQEAGILDSFWTSIAVPTALRRLVGNETRLGRELGRREFDELPWEKIRLCPHREIVRLLARRMGMSSLVRHGSRAASVDAVFRHLDSVVAKYILHRAPSEVSSTYAYEDGALETFAAAAKTGRRRIYDLPIAHWRTLHRVLSEERELAPDWAQTIHGLQDSPTKLQRKDTELLAADVVVVASSFTKRSLEGQVHKDVPVVVAPYGAPPPFVFRPLERRPNEPLRIMYAGHLDQRKGISYLIAALESLKVPWRATLAGALHENCPREMHRFLSRENVRFVGHVPHRDLLEEMADSHVFVFPSLVEGFAMVLTEAMAAGLPIITTDHTAGPDLIEDGVEGFIVPIRDTATIVARLSELYDDEQKRLEMAFAALASAAAQPWEAYEHTIARVIASDLATLSAGRTLQRTSRDSPNE